ncbi:hypothetical protein G7054_g3474 [Neopestalotiopsis clavispora]|nr:hypothetical protein G7054_g3474 [Neopestalotiopsis clavispora]
MIAAHLEITSAESSAKVPTLLQQLTSEYLVFWEIIPLEEEMSIDSSWSLAGGLTELSWFKILGLLLALYKLAQYGYRAFLHPYANYPGPKIAAVSNLWYAYHWFGGRYPWVIESTFKKYGDVVRIAPNELAFFRVEAQSDILMAGTTKGRPPFYKTEIQRWKGEHAGIAADQDPEKHRAVRKILAPAFNPRALNEQEPILHKYIDAFVTKAADHSVNGGVDLSEWFDWLACDIAGDVCYNQNFHNTRDTRSNEFLNIFRQASFVGTVHQVFYRWPLLHWLIFESIPYRLALVVPTILRENHRIVRSRVEGRDDLNHPDYFSLMVSDDHIPSDEFLVAQANHLIIGGLDPNTNLWTSLMHFLLTHPEKLQKLQNEIRERFPSYEEIVGKNVQGLPWLDAVIEESLRLHTNGAFGLPRISPGDVVDGHYIPKGCRVQTSIFSTSHSERYFSRPREFWPERWLPTTHPDYDVTFESDNRASFKPFSMGPRGCIGQNMGYLQTRLLFCKMAWKLDWEHVNKGKVDWERDVRLYSMWTKPPVVVRLQNTNLEKRESQKTEKLLA